LGGDSSATQLPSAGFDFLKIPPEGGWEVVKDEPRSRGGKREVGGGFIAFFWF